MRLLLLAFISASLTAASGCGESPKSPDKPAPGVASTAQAGPTGGEPSRTDPSKPATTVADSGGRDEGDRRPEGERRTAGAAPDDPRALARRLREAGVPLQPIPPELKASLQRTQEGEERARKADLPGLLSLLGEGQSEHKLAALAELHERLYVPFPGEDEGRARPFGPPGSKEAYIPPPPAEVVARRKEAVGPLMARLDDPSPKVREEALRLLGVCGPVAAAAIPKMMEMAKTNADPEPTEIWYAAGEAIGLVADPTDLPRLMRELAAAGGPQTHIAAQALANGRVDFKIAAATITEIAGSKTDNHDWESTIGSLLLLAKYEDAAVEAIFRLAADPVPERRREAIMALDALRGRALPWKGRLETIAAKDSDPKVRQDAEYVLMRLEHAAKRR